MHEGQHASLLKTLNIFFW